MASKTQPYDMTESLRRGHEATQMSIRGIVWFAVWFFVGLAASLVLMAGAYVWFVREHRAAEPTSPLLAGEAAQRALIPPEPRLQPSPSASNMPLDDLPRSDMQEMFREQSALVNGWTVDLLRGTVSMPVEQAMRLMAAPGGRRADTAAEQGQPTGSGESSGGNRP